MRIIFSEWSQDRSKGAAYLASLSDLICLDSWIFLDPSNSDSKILILRASEFLSNISTIQNCFLCVHVCISFSWFNKKQNQGIIQQFWCDNDTAILRSPILVAGFGYRRKICDVLNSGLPLLPLYDSRGGKGTQHPKLYIDNMFKEAWIVSLSD